MKFSVVIPAHNAADTLATAVASCRQPGHDVEVVVVENGSSDATASVAASLPVTLVRLDVGDRCVARNAGQDAASGEVIVFLDADDELLPGAFDAWAEALSDPRLDAAQGGTRYDGDGGATLVAAFAGAGLWRHLHVRNVLPISSIALRRRRLARWNPGQIYCEDWDYWLRALRGARVARLDVDMSLVHRHAAQTSADLPAMRGGSLVVYDRFWSDRIGLRNRAHRFLYAAIDASIYRGGPRRSDAERALHRRPALALVGMVLRLPGVQPAARSMIRRRFGY